MSEQQQKIERTYGPRQRAATPAQLAQYKREREAVGLIEWKPTSLERRLAQIIQMDEVHANARRWRIYPDRVLLDDAGNLKWPRPAPALGDNGHRNYQQKTLVDFNDIRQWLAGHYIAFPDFCLVQEIRDLIPPPMVEGKSAKAVGECIRWFLKSRGADCYPYEYKGTWALWALRNKEWLRTATPEGRRAYYNEQRHLT
jgi:hypothetical protein